LRHRPHPDRLAHGSKLASIALSAALASRCVMATSIVAAEHRLAAGTELRRDSGGQAADRGESSDTQEQADEEQPQAAKTDVKIAAGASARGPKGQDCSLRAIRNDAAVAHLDDPPHAVRQGWDRG
jgi:hypothetical protein